MLWESFYVEVVSEALWEIRNQQSIWRQFRDKKIIIQANHRIESQNLKQTKSFVLEMLGTKFYFLCLLYLDACAFCYFFANYLILSLFTLHFSFPSC